MLFSHYSLRFGVKLMKPALSIMIQGTHSDAGKSVLAAAFCRIFAQDGYRTAPFKSQNMALNSYITWDGKEIGRAQGVQAEAAFIEATTDMNPILIKPTRDQEAQIVVHGKPYKQLSAKSYRSDFYEQGLSIIQQAYNRLSHSYERIVIEGAGSPAEINLNDREMVNMRVARMTNSPVILVGDIDKGGVFASLVGTLQLLSPEDRDRIVGVLINKFRGDITLLEPGLKWFEDYTGKPVLGVIPYLDGLNIDAEDSVILDAYQQAASQHDEGELDIAVIRYPRISNFTDMDPFRVEPDCRLRWVSSPDKLGSPDLIILPGSKNTLEDMAFLRDSGLSHQILRRIEHNKASVIGICGGYQMMGESISDPHGVESSSGFIEGLALFPLQTELTQTKTTIRSRGTLTYQDQSLAVEGYEIHMGLTSSSSQSYTSLIKTDQGEDGCISNDARYLGTYFHGIFHNDEFRKVLLNQIRLQKGFQPISERLSYQEVRNNAYDRLADTVREHIQLERIEQIMKQYGESKEVHS
jgi:adenosylcobyric acid synthase